MQGRALALAAGFAVLKAQPCDAKKRKGLQFYIEISQLRVFASREDMTP